MNECIIPNLSLPYSYDVQLDYYVHRYVVGRIPPQNEAQTPAFGVKVIGKAF